ncbi:hypothetical protein BH792_gp103 [Staphylococcus phage Stau2]|uniref:Uncharacterized protein n=1 Tax=Staphylococcus phage Stau2 TaxID=1200862 RepID=A0A0U1ZUK8_9CAUD|nr:hypothetical protein BH792_gp103 [Staphylococcus phage Stau2]AKA61353.1 hypothetical protein Stau2_102 [Staphylococcus phage Stau2]
MAKRKPDTFKPKSNEYKHQPVNFAPTGNLSGRSTSFFNKKRKDIPDESIVVKYKPLFVKRFDNVTATDIKIQKKYALDLISEAVNIKKKYLVMKQKGKLTQTILHTDRVYYVYRGKKLIGKCSIREQRTFRGTHLIYIFSTRHRISVRKNSRLDKKRTPKKMIYKGGK